MEKLKNRINTRLIELGLNKTEFAVGIGESAQNINNWLTRDSIPPRKVEKVANYLKCTEKWLETGVIEESKQGDSHAVTRAKINELTQQVRKKENLINLEDFLRNMLSSEKLERIYKQN